MSKRKRLRRDAGTGSSALSSPSGARDRKEGEFAKNRLRKDDIAESFADLRITEEAIARVGMFFETRRALAARGELVQLQDAMLGALRQFDWTEVDAALLFQVAMATAPLYRALDDFPARLATADRWLITLLHLVLQAEAAGLPPLALARPAVVAATAYFGGAGDEILRRARRHLGFDAISGLLNEQLTGKADDPVALDARSHVRRTTEGHLRKFLPSWWYGTPRGDRADAIESSINMEIARSLRGRTTLDDLVSAVLEALPPDTSPATGLDWTARRAYESIRRDHERRRPTIEPGADLDHEEDPGASPDQQAVLRHLLDKIQDTRLHAVLEGLVDGETHEQIGRRLGVSSKTIQTDVARLRRLLDPAS